MPRVILCVVPTDVQAQAIIGSLKKSGFTDKNISVLSPDTSRASDQTIRDNIESAESTGLRYDGHWISSKDPNEIVGNTPEAAAGVMAGGVIGGALGVMAGIMLLAIPGVGPFLAVGPLFLALGGVAAGATVIGIAGLLTNVGVPESEAKRYDQKIRKGEILVAVHTDSEMQLRSAQRIFEVADAKDIHITSERNPADASYLQL